MSVFKRAGSPFYYSEFEIEGHRFCRSTRCLSRREALVQERHLKAEERAKLSERRSVATLTLDQAFGRYWIEHASKLAPAWAVEVERYGKQILASLDPEML